jgi:hypothetical protein
MVTAFKILIHQHNRTAWVDATIDEHSGHVDYDLPDWVNRAESWSVSALITPESDGQVIPITAETLYGRHGSLPEPEP